jgi:3-oxoacyl-[acyl-carrier protein] reductase
VDDINERIGAQLLARYGAGLPAMDQLRQPVSDQVRLDGVRAVVVGGGGANLGSAIVDRLCSLGASVAVVDRDGDAAARVALDAQQRWDTPTFALRGDASDWDEAASIAERIATDLGGIDVWVNNVGGGPAGAFVERSRRELELVVRLTFSSALAGCHAVAPHMIAQGTGRIINISGEGAKLAMRDLVVYNACKAAVNGLTRNLAQELGQFGISVVGVSPGVMLGPPVVAWLQNQDAHQSHVDSMSQTLPRIPLGRGCRPEEVANVIAFLASPAASYVNGTTVSVGGGLAD